MYNRNANGLFTFAKVSTKVVNLFFTPCFEHDNTSDMFDHFEFIESQDLANESVQLHRQVCRCNDLASSKLVRETIRGVRFAPEFL